MRFIYFFLLMNVRDVDSILIYCSEMEITFFSLPQGEKDGIPPPAACLQYCEWGWIICRREISVSWGLGHWQSSLLIAVIWDILSVSMSTLNPRNCSVPIWLSIFHAFTKSRQIQAAGYTYNHMEKERAAHGSLSTAEEEVKPGSKYWTTC